jgi:hypothetical protein
MITGHCFFAFWVYTSMSWDEVIIALKKDRAGSSEALKVFPLLHNTLNLLFALPLLLW